MQMQTLVVSNGASSECQSLVTELQELSGILPTETPTGDNMKKKELIERMTSGSASLIHFVGHGTKVGKTVYYRCRNVSTRVDIIPARLEPCSSSSSSSSSSSLFCTLQCHQKGTSIGLGSIWPVVRSSVHTSCMRNSRRTNRLSNPRAHDSWSCVRAHLVRSHEHNRLRIGGGEREREEKKGRGSRVAHTIKYRIIHFSSFFSSSPLSFSGDFRPWAPHEGGSAGLCPGCAGRRHSVPPRIQVEYSYQGKHHSDDDDLRLYGGEQGWPGKNSR